MWRIFRVLCSRMECHRAISPSWRPRGPCHFLLGTIPLFRVFHGIYYQLAMKLGKKHKEYDNSKLSALGRLISQGGQIASLVYFRNSDYLTGRHFGRYAQCTSTNEVSRTSGGNEESTTVAEFPRVVCQLCLWSLDCEKAHPVQVTASKKVLFPVARPRDI